MASAEDEKIFLRAAVDAIPKVAEIVCGFRLKINLER